MKNLLTLVSETMQELVKFAVKVSFGVYFVTILHIYVEYKLK